MISHTSLTAAPPCGLPVTAHAHLTCPGSQLAGAQHDPQAPLGRTSDPAGRGLVEALGAEIKRGNLT
jgi:hypothetical protein